MNNQLYKIQRISDTPTPKVWNSQEYTSVHDVRSAWDLLPNEAQAESRILARPNTSDGIWGPAVRVVFANSPYVSTYGDFRFSPINVEEALMLLAEAVEIDSAVGHQATAELIEELLHVTCSVKRVNYRQRRGDVMLILKLNKRQPEGAILDRESLEKVGYTLGKLERLN